MMLIRQSEDFSLYIAKGVEHSKGMIEERKEKRYSSPFTLEVVDVLCSLDEADYNHECSQLMNVEDFHIEREWANAD